MKSAIALVVLVAAVGSAHADGPTLRIVDVKANVGDWIVLKADTDAPIVKWRSLSKVLKLAPAELQLGDRRTTLATCNKVGKHKVHAVCAKGDVPSEIIEFTVTIEADEPDPPAPVPPIPPPPVPPVDPLAKRIQDALASDKDAAPDKAKYAAQLAGFYAAMSKHVEAGNTPTVGDLLSDYQTAMKAVLPDGVIANTRKACGVEVFAVSGDDAEKVIDAALKKKFVDLFNALAAALAVK